MTAPARFDVHASLDTANANNDKFETRVFRFPEFNTVAYDGSDGWHYRGGVFTLSRAVDNNPTAYANFDFQVTTESVGRSTWGYWMIFALLMTKHAPVRQLLLGNHEVGRAARTINLQGNVAASTVQSSYGTVMFPMSVAELESIDEVYLFSSGQQESL